MLGKTSSAIFLHIIWWYLVHVAHVNEGNRWDKCHQRRILSILFKLNFDSCFCLYHLKIWNELFQWAWWHQNNLIWRTSGTEVGLILVSLKKRVKIFILCKLESIRTCLQGPTCSCTKSFFLPSSQGFFISQFMIEVSISVSIEE